MNLERVLNEIKIEGVYLRGDSKVSFENDIAKLSLNLKDSSLIQDLIPNLPWEFKNQINYPNFTKISELTKLPIQKKGNNVEVVSNGNNLKEAVSQLVDFANSIKYPDVHITRRAGAYILILNGRAVYATDSLVDYCPLAKKLFTRHDYCDNSGFKTKLLRELNEQTLGEFKMFSDKRNLREREAKVPFGSSETMMDAFRKGYVDCAVQVCEGVGSVVTLDAESSQGVGAVMTGTFYTTPIKDLIERGYSAGVFPVFPETAEINPIAGVEAALRLDKKKIVVTTAAGYNKNLDLIKEFEKDDLEIYRFALCSTGVDENTANIMAQHADLVWSCASKYAKEIIEPQSLLQVGLKIPVYVMTFRGFDIIKNRCLVIDPTIENELENLKLGQGERYFIAHKRDHKLVVKSIKEIENSWLDSPRPLV